MCRWSRSACAHMIRWRSAWQLNICVCFLSQITAVCREAALLALQEDIKAAHVEARHFESALNAVKPRIPDSLIQSYISYQQQHSGLCFFWPRRYGQSRNEATSFLVIFTLFERFFGCPRPAGDFTNMWWDIDTNNHQLNLNDSPL